MPFEGDSAVAVALKQVSQAPQRAERAQPAGVAGARRRRHAGAGEGPGAPVPGRRGVHRGARRGRQGSVRSSGAARPSSHRRRRWSPRSRSPRRRGRAARGGASAATAAGCSSPAGDHPRRPAGLSLTRDTTTEVTPVTGEQLDTALRLLEQDGFQVGERTRVQRDAPAGQVLEQDPSGEASLDCTVLSFFCDKPEVDLTISAGPGSAVVPDVAGLDRGAAEQRLQRRDLGVEVVTASSRSVAEGAVISSDPAAGERAQRGSSVTLTVSSGPRQVNVPALIDLAAAPRSPESASAASSPASARRKAIARSARVIDQSPGPGSTLDEGSTVSITVSSGVATVKVPGLVGQTRRRRGGRAALARAHPGGHRAPDRRRRARRSRRPAVAERGNRGRGGVRGVGRGRRFRRPGPAPASPRS